MLAEPRTARELRSARPSAAHERRGATTAPATTGRVAYACPLPGDVVALAGSFRDDLVVPARADARHLACRRILFPQPVGGDESEEGRAVGFLALVESATVERAIVDLGGWAVTIEPEHVEIVDVLSLAWLGLADVDATTRVAAAAFLATAQSFGADPSSALPLANELRAFRDAIRERPTHCRIEADHPQGLLLDSVHRIDERSFYVRGWMRDGVAEIVSLSAIAPEGARVELIDGLVRFARPDVEEFYGARPEEWAVARPGFIGYFELDAPSHLADGWVIEMKNHHGLAVEAVCPAVVDDVPTTRAVILDDLVHETPGDEMLVRDHAFPALSKLQERRARDGMVKSVMQYGVPPIAPDVTIVVPLYQRIDFLEHQLAHWVEDPEVAGADILYVLDSPEFEEDLNRAAASLHRLYDVPFRTVILWRNVGFAEANNAGASLARGRLLLMLNSDVVPDRPGWLSTMVNFLDRTPGAGAVGPKLVYEDESIQHAGMYFLRPEGSPWWENAHYFKGLHRSFPPANMARVVPAITGACLLISLDLWRRVGGLSGTYVQGDYEDSDLCLRVADLEFECWYLPDVELYHLEGQSYPTQLRRLTSRFNTWLHTHLWGDRITAVMQEASVYSRGSSPQSRKGVP